MIGRADHAYAVFDRRGDDACLSGERGGAGGRARRSWDGQASDLTASATFMVFCKIVIRVVSVLDSGAEGRARVQIAVATLSGDSLRQTVHTHCAPVQQAAKLVAALLRVAWVTAGLAESNGSLPPGL